MIKQIIETKCAGANVLAHLEAQKRMEEHRPESSFGGSPVLTRKEIAKGNKLVERSRKITVW